VVSGSAKYTQTAPAAAIQEYTRKVPDPPSAAVATGNVWLTCICNGPNKCQAALARVSPARA
jgi:hypothetical protein